MMGKIYKGQSVAIILTAGTDLTGATAKIGYRKPDQTEGFWPGSVTDTANGIVEYDTQHKVGDDMGDLDQAGLWKFWLDVTFGTGDWVAGEPFEQGIYNVGE